MALALIGADIICETGEPSKEAKACAIFYENVKNKALAAYDWPFASKTSMLSKLKTEMTNGLNYFAMPSDCLAPRELLNASYSDTFCLEGGTIVTRMEFANLRYTFSSEDTYIFPPDFIDGVAYLLASTVAVFLADSPEASQLFASSADVKLEYAAASLALFKAAGCSILPLGNKITGLSQQLSNI